jgi:Flp pilus assembly protein TadG
MMLWEPVMRLLSKCRRFLSDVRGNIAILFGIAIVPMFGIMGVALDYSMANMQRVALQAAADNTILALSKMPQPMGQADLDKYGWQIFQANVGSSTLLYKQEDLVITASGSGKLNLNIQTQYPMTLGRVLNTIFGTSPMMPVSVKSEVLWGNTRLRIALVLDNTGSMADDGKMEALKTATTSLLTTLQNLAKNPEDVYVSIIPFSKDVNIGALSEDKFGVKTYQQSGWIYWDNAAKDDNKSWDALNGTCSISSKKNRNSCVTSGVCSDSAYTSQGACQASGGSCSVSGNDSPSACSNAGTCSTNGSTKAQCESAHCSSSKYTTKKACQDAGRTWYNAGTWTPATWTGATWTAGVWTPKDHSEWNGCVTDRGTPTGPTSATAVGYDQKVDLPSGTDETLWPAEQFASCTAQIVGLTNNWSTLSSTVDSMKSVGNTNTPIGLVWGWQSLVGGGPLLAPAKDPQYAYSDTIILMSDGENTQNRWTTSAGNIDKRMLNGTSPNFAGTCANIKATGVQIYSVQVNTGGDPTSTLLKNCATNPSMFFELKTAGALVTTFDQIGSALANIHISR